MTGYLNSPPASVVAYLVAGSATTLAIDGITTGDFIMLDAAGTEHVIAGQPVDGALTAALSAEEVDGLLAAGAQRIRVVSDDRVIAAGPVRRRDGWSGDCAQHQMLARVITGPAGEKGADGSGLSSGPGRPDDAGNVIGDLYLDTVSGDLYRWGNG